MFGRRTGTEVRTGRETHHRRREHFGSRPRAATAVGSALGAVIVLAAAGALGIGAIGFATSIAVGMALGGWAGGEVSERRARRRAPREALRRRRSIRIFRITRTLRRRRVNRAAIWPTGKPGLRPRAGASRITIANVTVARPGMPFGSNAFRYRVPLHVRVWVPTPEAGGFPVLATVARAWQSAPI